MPQMMKYIGPTHMFKAAGLDQQDLAVRDFEVQEGQSYLVDLVPDGQRIVINGQNILTPGASIWVVFINERCKIPYAPELLSNHWYAE